MEERFDELAEHPELVLHGGRIAHGAAQDEPALEHAAAAQFLEQHMWDASRQILKRRYREGDTAIDGYAEDYAYLVFCLLELFQAGGDPQWLEWARTLQDELLSRR